MAGQRGEHVMSTVVVLIATLVLTLGVTLPALAPYHNQPNPAAENPLDKARAQLNTAKTHAGFAAAAGGLSGVQQHTGHATNCLVGADDRRFERKWGNVCEGQGSGALVDLKATGARGADALKIAEEAAKVGLDTLSKTDLAAAQAGAKKLAGMLDDVLKALR